MQYIKSDQFDHANRAFRVKHSFFVHTLEEEILLALLEAMEQHKAIRMELRSSRHGTVSAAECIPLQVLRHLLSVQSALTLQDIRARTYREGFEESLLSIISKIESGAWNLFERDGSLYISRLGGTFLTPLSALEKSYLKALLSDPRIGLFLDQDQLEALRDMLSSVPPLWRPEQFYYYDRFTDGDPWE